MLAAYLAIYPDQHSRMPFWAALLLRLPLGVAILAFLIDRIFYYGYILFQRYSRTVWLLTSHFC